MPHRPPEGCAPCDTRPPCRVERRAGAPERRSITSESVVASLRGLSLSASPRVQADSGSRATTAACSPPSSLTRPPVTIALNCYLRFGRRGDRRLDQPAFTNTRDGAPRTSRPIRAEQASRRSPAEPWMASRGPSKKPSLPSASVTAERAYWPPARNNIVGWGSSRYRAGSIPRHRVHQAVELLQQSHDGVSFGAAPCRHIAGTHRGRTACEMRPLGTPSTSH